MFQALRRSLLATLFCLALPAIGAAKPPYWVYAYILQNQDTNGKTLNLATDIPWADITHIGDAFGVPTASGGIDMSGTKNTALINAAHNTGTRCYLSLGGGGQSGTFASSVASGTVDAFVANIAATLRNYNYDGVDIDWEFPTASQKTVFMTFIQKLYPAIKALPASSVDGQPRTLTVYIGSGESNCAINMGTIGNSVDALILGAYDFGYDQWQGPIVDNATSAGFCDGRSMHADVNSAFIDFTDAGFPASKFVLGSPLYSDFPPGQYNEVDIIHLLKGGVAGAYSPGGQMEQAYTWQGNATAANTQQSFCDKTNWALSHGFKGISIWEVCLGLPYTDPVVAGIWNTMGGNNSCLNLGPTATPTRTPTPVVASTWRVHAGGVAYTDSLGQAWAIDTNFSGGTVATGSPLVNGTADAALYQSERYGNPFTYTFNVPAGAYLVTLKFAETYWTAAGQRVFNVSINGNAALTNFDIAATAGLNQALDRGFPNIAPNASGQIVLSFGPASADNAKVNSISIVPMPANWTPSPTPTATFAPIGYVRSQGQTVVGPLGQVLKLRGVNLGNWLEPEGYMWLLGANGDRPRKIEARVQELLGTTAANNFWAAYRNTYIQEADIRRIAELGFNCIRLPFNSRLLYPDGGTTFNLAEFAYMDNVIAWCAKYGVYVIVDMHCAPGGQTGANIDDSANDIPELYTVPANQDRAVALWTFIANRYKNNSWIAAYDLLNEPIAPQHNQYLPQLYPICKRMGAAIRTVDTNHMLMVEGGNWANNWSSLDVPFDANQCYSFHKYWDNTDQASIQGYVDHRAQWNRPIWLGETGENTNAWDAAAFQLIDDNNIGWCFWPWKKMSTSNTPYSVNAPANWNLIQAYVDGGAKPDAATSQAIFNELLANIRIENSQYQCAVVQGIFRANGIPAANGAITATPQPTVVAPACAFARRINAGGAQVTDSQGKVWAADQAYATGGYGYIGGSAATSTLVPSGTSDPALYQSNRWGMSEYRFDVPNGRYQVRLLFAENYWNAFCGRVFSVSLNGQVVASNLELLRKAGYNAAYTETYSTDVTGGSLRLQFTANEDNAQVNAIEVVRVDDPCNASTPTFTATRTPSATASATGTATPSRTATASSTATPSSSVTPSQTSTLTVSATLTSTSTQTVTPTMTVTPSITVTFSSTVTPSISPTRTATLASSFTRTATPKPSDTSTFTRTVTPAPTVTSGVPLGKVVSLQALANNLYVSANCATCTVQANRAVANTWEQFLVVDLGNGQVALKALMNNLYVSADNAGASPLIANRATASGWEAFVWVTPAAGQVQLKAVVNGKFVCADNYGSSPLIANRTTAAAWETFNVTVIPGVSAGSVSAARMQPEPKAADVRGDLPTAAKPLIAGPNPAKDSTTAYFLLESSTTARLSVYNLLGERILSTEARAYGAGQNQELLDLRSLASGLYILSLEGQGLVHQFKLAVLK